MPKELLWLTWTAVLTGVMWIPYILDRIQVRGLVGAMANPAPADKPQSPWAQRLMHAHRNAIENLVVFATLVLILDALNISTPATVVACATFFYARLAHARLCGGLFRRSRAGADAVRDYVIRFVIPGRERQRANPESRTMH